MGGAIAFTVERPVKDVPREAVHIIYNFLMKVLNW